jgi:hypothetical protein
MRPEGAQVARLVGKSNLPNRFEAARRSGSSPDTAPRICPVSV